MSLESPINDDKSGQPSTHSTLTFFTPSCGSKCVDLSPSELRTWVKTSKIEDWRSIYGEDLQGCKETYIGSPV